MNIDRYKNDLDALVAKAGVCTTESNTNATLKSLHVSPNHRWEVE